MAQIHNEDAEPEVGGESKEQLSKEVDLLCGEDS